MNTLKDQLSVVIKAQLDFQQKVENQISMLQTMMQTVCQLVNTEIIANKKPISQVQSAVTSTNTIPTSSQAVRLRREQPDFQSAEPRTTSIPRQTLLPKSNPIEESQPYSARISSGKLRDDLHVHDEIHLVSILATPIEIQSHRSSIYDEGHDPSKRFSRPVSALSANESNSYEMTKSVPTRRTIDQDSRLTNISPIEVPSSYDMFESGLPKGNPNNSMLRNGVNRPSSAATSTVPSVSE